MTDKSPKILIVSVDFPPHTDGVSTVSHELATRLSDLGEDIIVIGPKSRDDCSYDSRQKFKVIRTPLYEWGYLRFIPILFVMPFLIMKYRIKRVIAMNIGYGGVIAYLFSKILGFSYILWAYGYEFGKFENNYFIKKLYLRIYENSLFIAAITDFVKSRLLRFGVGQNKVVIIKPGTDPLRYYPVKVADDFRQRYCLENKRVILSVGRLIKRKGFDMTIRAMQDVVKIYPEAVYVIVGEGPFKERLGELSRKLKVGEHILFTGRVSNEGLLNFYNTCDLFIMPSRTLDDRGDIEGFGIVFLEAGACGKPVIGGLDGGMGEAIENGVTGLLVNSFDTKAIFSGIIKILSDREYARFLGENGRKRIIEELNWDRAVKAFYSNMLAHSL
jgi:phosphatidylinositol alpha-1,6-mannosyltransferase